MLHTDGLFLNKGLGGADLWLEQNLVPDKCGTNAVPGGEDLGMMIHGGVRGHRKQATTGWTRYHDRASHYEALSRLTRLVVDAANWRVLRHIPRRGRQVGWEEKK